MKLKQEEWERDEVLALFEVLFEEREGSERPSRIFGKADSMVFAKSICGKGWGRTSLRVRASIEEVAVFFWNFDSRANMENSGDIERTCEEIKGGPSFKMVVTKRHALESAHGAYHRDRIFTSEFTHHRIDADTVDFLVSPSSEEVTGAENSAEAKETVAIRLKRLAGGWTKLDYACDLELGFGTSHGASKFSIDRRLGEIAEASIYFQRLVPLEDYGVEDGQCLGHDLLWQASSAKKRVERLKKVVEKSRVLGCLRHSWMEAMLTTALQGSLNMNQTV